MVPNGPGDKADREGSGDRESLSIVWQKPSGVLSVGKAQDEGVCSERDSGNVCTRDTSPSASNGDTEAVLFAQSCYGGKRNQDGAGQVFFITSCE